MQVELEIMLPEDMSVKESHDIALMLQHKVVSCYCSNAIFVVFVSQADLACAMTCVMAEAMCTQSVRRHSATMADACMLNINMRQSSIFPTAAMRDASNVQIL